MQLFLNVDRYNYSYLIYEVLIILRNPLLILILHIVLNLVNAKSNIIFTIII